MRTQDDFAGGLIMTLLALAAVVGSWALIIWGLITFVAPHLTFWR